MVNSRQWLDRSSSSLAKAQYRASYPNKVIHFLLHSENFVRTKYLIYKDGSEVALSPTLSAKLLSAQESPIDPKKLQTSAAFGA